MGTVKTYKKLGITVDKRRKTIDLGNGAEDPLKHTLPSLQAKIIAKRVPPPTLE